MHENVLRSTSKFASQKGFYSAVLNSDVRESQTKCSLSTLSKAARFKTSVLVTVKRAKVLP
jgi:hypothetical protein